MVAGATYDREGNGTTGGLEEVDLFGLRRYTWSMTNLAAQQAVARDTVVSIVARDGYDVLTAVAAGSVAAVLLVILILVSYAFLQARRASKALERAKGRFSADPAVAALRRTAENVESISEAVRGEVAKLTDSVSRLSDRLTQASDRMEERIEEFNALMEVVQDEAEGVFVEGAATARGVRAGLGNLSSRKRPVDGHHAPASEGRVIGQEEGEPDHPAHGGEPENEESEPSHGNDAGS
jgi:TolA-binding protein